MIFHLYQDIRNEWRWYLAAPNGIKLAAATQGYVRRGDCVQAIKRMKEATNAPLMYDNFATIADVTAAARFAHTTL
jgi:uncharacterized protein YegP (UPF0339 family)